MDVKRAVPNYQRVTIKDALALLRLAVSPDDRQSDEAFRRVCNTPARGLGPKAQEVIEAEAGWRGVSLLRAVETAPLTPKVRSAALAFADATASCTPFIAWSSRWYASATLSFTLASWLAGMVHPHSCSSVTYISASGTPVKR